jgi:flagellar FliJ protein
MKKFQYRLQPLLHLRQQVEDEKKRKVGALQTEINDQQNRALKRAARIQQEGEILRRQHESGKIDLEWVSHYRRYVTHTQQAIAQRIAEVARIQKKLNGARLELNEAAKNRRILEKLKEKQQERFEAEIRHRERIEEDEIGTRMFLHNRVVSENSPQEFSVEMAVK